MLNVFRKQKKVLLAIQYEDQVATNRPKRARIEIPNLNASDFEFLNNVCAILEIFDKETHKVFTFFILVKTIKIKFCSEKSTASTIIPTLRRMWSFLQREDIHENVRFLADELAIGINNRVRSLASNERLQVATVLDPRYAYDDNIWAKNTWADRETKLINFAKSGIYFNFFT